MLSYIHSFHAGNHADVLKHAVLCLILEYMKKKEKPFAAFDSHSGEGVYDLSSDEALKTGEAKDGIVRLLDYVQKSGPNPAAAPAIELLGPYLKIAREYLAAGKYPGSPEIERILLRQGDTLTLSELHPKSIQILKENMKKPPLVQSAGVAPQIHARNGWETIVSLTPPKTIKRGFILIDPAYEDTEEYETCADTVSKIHQKWPGATIAVWYPLVEKKAANLSQMKEYIAASCASTENNAESKILDIQLLIKENYEMTGLSSLYGSGLFVVQSPYTLENQMKTLLPFLKEALGGKAFSLARP